MGRKRREPRVGEPEYPTPTYHVPALEQGLDILEFLAQATGPVSQSEIARGISASSSQVHRLITCLMGREYVRRHRYSMRIDLTTRLFRIAHEADPARRIGVAAKEHLRAAAEDIGGCVYIAVLDGEQVVVIARELPGGRFPLPALPDRSEPPAPLVGTTVPALLAATGRLLLANTHPQWLNRALWRSDAITCLDGQTRATLRATFALLRSDRFVRTGEGLLPGTRDTAIVLGSYRDAMAAVAASVPGWRRDTDYGWSILEALARHGAALAEDAGWTPPKAVQRPRPP